MKPWYWPVTTTAYKLIVGFVLGCGSGYIVENLFPSTPDLIQLSLMVLLGLSIYISLVTKDWL